MADQSFDLSAFSDQLAATVAAAATRVVGISSDDARPSSGIIWRKGQIVASDGALGEAESVTVTLPDGTSIKATIKGRDPSTDVVLIEAETGDVADWAAAPVPAVGSFALVVGRGEHSPIATHGLVAEVGPTWQSLHGGRIDARIRLGLFLGHRSEGGAAIAANGALLGMAVSAPRRRNLVIPTATIERAVAALAKSGYVARGFLGVSLHPLGGKGNTPGVIVVDVEPGSPAATAGIVVGDILTTWDNEPLQTPRDVLHRLGTDAAAKTVVLGIVRGGQPTELSVTIGERPRN